MWKASFPSLVLFAWAVTVGFLPSARAADCPHGLSVMKFAAVVRASTFGWDAADATECLTRAQTSGVEKVIVDRHRLPSLSRRGRGKLPLCLYTGGFAGGVNVTTPVEGRLRWKVTKRTVNGVCELYLDRDLLGLAVSIR